MKKVVCFVLFVVSLEFAYGARGSAAQTDPNLVSYDVVATVSATILSVSRADTGQPLDRVPMDLVIQGMVGCPGGVGEPNEMEEATGKAKANATAYLKVFAKDPNVMAIGESVFVDSRANGKARVNEVSKATALCRASLYFTSSSKIGYRVKLKVNYSYRCTNTKVGFLVLTVDDFRNNFLARIVPDQGTPNPGPSLDKEITVEVRPGDVNQLLLTADTFGEYPVVPANAW